MPKQYNINWRDKDQKELERTVKNFNAKIRRLEKKNPSQAQFLPDRLKVSEVRAKSKTRADFKRQINSAKRFSRRGAEEVITTKGGATVTKFELKEAQIKTRVVNRLRNKKAKELTAEKGVAGSIKSENLRPRRAPQELSDEDFDRATEALEQEIGSTFDLKRDEQWVENYKTSIRNQLGQFGSEILQFLSGKDVSELAKAGLGNPFLRIKFVYGFEDAQLKAERILEEWKLAVG